MKDLMKEFDLTRSQLRKILAGRKRKLQVIKELVIGEEFKFALIGDTHLCSRYEALNELHTFYEICRKDDIKHVIHAGDLVDGGMTHPGWENEIYVFGADRQVEHTVENYPKVEGITTYFIGGSHDYSFYKKAGVEIGERISDKRKDMVFLGRIGGDIEIGGIKIRLVHPSGGMPYARSYRGQKIAENIASGEKPHILAIGHLHISLYFHYRNIHIFQVGCFQKQTPYLMEKGLNPDIGGWIAEAKIANDKKRSVISITPAWIQFFV